MIVILGYDGLEISYVEKFGFKNLMQENYGVTNLEGFSEPRTIVIWSSFLTGKNTEKEALAVENLWRFHVPVEQTFLNKFKHVAIDVPGFNYQAEAHDLNRKQMAEAMQQKITIEEYDKECFKHHREVKADFFRVLDEACENKRSGQAFPELIFGYFALPDTIAHLSFGKETKMKIVYKELDEIAEDVRSRPEVDTILIIADHGMKNVGRFGDHSMEGFWSLNKDTDLGKLNPIDFRKIVESWKQ
jgi:hypothetical protein